MSLQPQSYTEAQLPTTRLYKYLQEIGAKPGFYKAGPGAGGKGPRMGFCFEMPTEEAAAAIAERLTYYLRKAGYTGTRRPHVEETNKNRVYIDFPNNTPPLTDKHIAAYDAYMKELDSMKGKQAASWAEQHTSSLITGGFGNLVQTPTGEWVGRS